jgi:hypothetical protein
MTACTAIAEQILGGLAGIAAEGAAKGYADNVRILFAYDLATSSISAFSVVAMRETPGIGDKISAAKAKFDTFRDGTTANLGKVEAALRGAAAEVDKFNNKDLKDKNATVTVNYRATGAANKLRNVPLMASGGIVTRPTLAIVGEAGPEAVVPLNQYRSSSGGGGTVINVNINGGLDSAETIARTVQTALLDLKRRQGVSLGLA